MYGYNLNGLFIFLKFNIMNYNITTFAQENNRAFDWNAFLNKKNIEHYEWAYARIKAGSWVSCACGNQCSIIPRYGMDDEPKDIILSDLGGRKGFFGAIKQRNIPKAKIFLRLIEIRSNQLIMNIYEPF